MFLSVLKKHTCEYCAVNNLCGIMEGMSTKKNNGKVVDGWINYSILFIYP